MRYNPHTCSKCGVTYDRNRQSKECPHGTPVAGFDKDVEPTTCDCGCGSAQQHQTPTEESR